jgi:very-short-patch-repair endonuclease
MTSARAKSLRSNMTDAERRLWYFLRAHRFNGTKFKRQAVIGKYIVDFVCFEKHLVIEVDGGQHADNETDRRRTRWLEDQGFRVLRFWNNEVLQNTVGVPDFDHSRDRKDAAATPLPARRFAARHPLPQGERGQLSKS